MDALTNARGTMLRSTPLALAVALLAGCGESDLPEHHREILAQATVEPAVGAANGADTSGGEGDGGANEAPMTSVPGAGNGGDSGGGGAPAEPGSGGSDPGVEPAPAAPAAPGGDGDDGGDSGGGDAPAAPGSGGTDPGVEPAPAAPGGDGGGDGGDAPATPGSGETDPGVGPAPAAPEGTGNDDGATDGGAGAAEGGAGDGGGDGDGGAGDPAPAAGATVPTGSTDDPSADPSVAAGPVENVDLDDYTLVFADEFDAGPLDASKWKTAFDYARDRHVPVEGELQYYVDALGREPDLNPGTFTFADGTLAIRAEPTPESFRSEQSLGDEWFSGVLSTSVTDRDDAGGFLLQRGDYAEVRVAVPENPGAGATFSLIASDFSQGLRPIVFAMRHDGARPDELEHDYRFSGEDRRESPRSWTAELAEGQAFHTVGISWEEDALVYFVDGRASYRIRGEDLPVDPLYLVINLAVGGRGTSAPAEGATEPMDFVLDHVRVWRPNPGS